MRILASPAFVNEKVNPYNALLYREINNIEPIVEEYSHKKSLLGPYDVLHFHWPDGFINAPHLIKALQRIILLALVVISTKITGRKIVWTVHNITPHDAYHPRLSARFMEWFANRCDGYIFMSEENKAAFLAHYTLTKTPHNAIIPHGHYRTSYSTEVQKESAKKLLGLPADKKVLLCFGMIKPYKNVDRLISVFRQAALDDYILVIAGTADSATLSQQLKTSVEDAEDKIKLLLKFIPDEEVATYHSAADIVILPYKAILNSGALLLALSFNRPVIAPHIGAFITLQKELGAAWIHSYTDDLDTHTLHQAIQSLESAQRSHICPLDNYAWGRLAQSTLQFYRAL
jgi:beta-1,4-mannosyltransferase